MTSPNDAPPQERDGPFFEAAHIPRSGEQQVFIEPVFSGGPVQILAISKDPRGFKLQSAASRRRREILGADDAERIPLNLTDDQTARLSREFQGPARFNALQASKVARTALRVAEDRGASEDELAPLREEFEKASEQRRNAPIGGEQKFNGGVLLDYARKVFGYTTTAVRTRHRLETGNFEEGETRESAQAELDAALAGWDYTLSVDAEKLKKQDQIDVGLEVARATRDTFLRGEAVPAETLEQYRGTLADIRAGYAAMGKKAGMRNIRVDDNVVTFETVPVQFGSYTVLAHPESSAEAKHVSMLVGAAAIPITTEKDGSRRLIVQRRAVAVQHLYEEKMSPGNRSYTGDAGAGIAGVHDATYQQLIAAKEGLKASGLRTRLAEALAADERDQDQIDVINEQIAEFEKQFKVDPISSESVDAQLMREGGEEIGIRPNDVVQLIKTGVANDRMKPHQEITAMIILNKSAAEMHVISRDASRNANLGDADFEEKWFDIPATPEAIEILLTVVENPIPPTHTAAYVAVGYNLKVQRDGVEAADEWLHRVEAGVAANYARMDAKVEAYYDAHPEAYAMLPERFWGGNAPTRNRHGVDPSFAPEEQGLKSLQDALVDARLVEDDRTVVPVAELYDADGVLTNAETKEVNRQAITVLANKLRNGVKIGINTGRSTRWTEANIIPLLLEELGDPQYLSNFVVIAEKAGAWEYLGDDEEEGQKLISRHSKALTVPEDLKRRVNDLAADGRYSRLMGNLDPKTTMISVEKHDDIPQGEFDAVKQQFAEELRAIVAELGYGHLFKVDVTTIAVDVENANVGKAAGTDRFLQWLKDGDTKAETFKMVGDSPSDIAMALAAERLGLDVVMFYVGKKSDLEGVHSPENIIFSEDEYGEVYDRGTVALMNAGVL